MIPDDRLKPSQPFFVLEAEQFTQEIYLRQGISHFYTFQLSKKQSFDAVPDGCIDMLFVYHDDQMTSYVCGPVLECSIQHWQGKQDVFGVRFLPGFKPAGLTMEIKDLIGKKVKLNLFSELAYQTDFYQRIRVFLEIYSKLEKAADKPYGKQALIMEINKMAYLSNGTIRIGQIVSQTGYSESYINQVYHEKLGMSPKTFCKIIQFQKALDVLNYGPIEKMTDLAVNLGYYDQPQFTRDFKKYAGMTPKQYLRKIQQKHYQQRILNANYF